MVTKIRKLVYFVLLASMLVLCSRNILFCLKTNDFPSKVPIYLHSGLNQEFLADLLVATKPSRLKELAKKYKNEYTTGEPFPHAVIDELFPMSFTKEIEAEIEQKTDSSGCTKGAQCFYGKQQNYKSGITKEEMMGPHTRAVFHVMRSAHFVNFLQEISGIPNLIADPEYRGSGVHITTRGGHLDVHSDFNYYVKHDMHRRVNTFLYLNPDWEDSWGGALELWNRNMTQCKQRINPLSNRFVAFTTTDFSYHGSPIKISGPPGRARRSLALYYYTKDGPPKENCLGGICATKRHHHSTLWYKPKGCEACQQPMCKAYSDKFLFG